MRLFLGDISTTTHFLDTFGGESLILDIIYLTVANIDLKHQDADTAMGRYLENTEVVRPEGYGCTSVSHTCTVSPKGKFKLQWSSTSFYCPPWLSQVFLRSSLCCMWVSIDNWAKDTHVYLLLISLTQWLSDMLLSSASVICFISKGNS